MDWRHRAICKEEDPELFFPVVSDCLAWALASGQDAGVWGAMSEDERRAFKRRNSRYRARTNA